MEPSSVIFVCLHGAAKSVVAAAHFERLARERGLALRAEALGVEPDPALAPAAVRGLAAEGLDVGGRQPRAATREALAGAVCIVSFGCDLAGVAPAGMPVERWDEVPAVSEGYAAAREAIVARVGRLVEDLAAAGAPPR